MSVSGTGSADRPSVKRKIIILLDEIRRERNADKFRTVQFPRLKGLVEALNKAPKNGDKL